MRTGMICDASVWGRMAEVLNAKNDRTTGPIEVSRILQKRRPQVHVIDVRRRDDYLKGHIPGAINLPMEEWDHLEGLSKNDPQIFYCASQDCQLAEQGAEHFARLGFPAMEMEGGFEAWLEKGLPIEKEI
ncbi:MAG: rhodanese-like domain-containing protein [Candidatus Omnitrophota bacterium]